MSTDSPDPIDQFLTLLENPRVKTFLDNMINVAVNVAVEKKMKDFCETSNFKNSVETAMLCSEIKPIKRISMIETVLGINGTIDYEDEDRELSVLEKIDTLEDKFNNLDLNAVENPLVKEDTEIIPTTKTEHRACGLFEELKKARDRAGHKFLSSDEMNHFLRYGVEEEYRVKDGQNIRQIKKEVLAKMKKMFSADVFLSQKTTGWKNYRIVLKA